MTTDIEYMDIPVTVDYHYEPLVRGTYYDPPEGGFVEVYDILVEGVSIYELVASAHIGKLEEQLYDYESDRD